MVALTTGEKKSDRGEQKATGGRLGDHHGFPGGGESEVVLVAAALVEHRVDLEFFLITAIDPGRGNRIDQGVHMAPQFGCG